MFEVRDNVRESSTIVGAGAYVVNGAPQGFDPFSVFADDTYTLYMASDDVQREVAIGQVKSGPPRVERIAILQSSNGGAAVNWTGANPIKIRCAPSADFAVPRVTSKSIAGAAATTVLTQLEQRCDVLILEGALTGDQIVEVDGTPWAWPAVINQTTGAFTVQMRVTGQTGVQLLRGRRHLLINDGTDVRSDVLHKKAADVASAATLDLNVDGDLVDVTGNTGITLITLEEGREVTTRFTGTPTITPGASLVLPGGAVINVAAGDNAVWRGYAAQVVRCKDYTRADGKPVIGMPATDGSSLVLLCPPKVAASSASVSFTSADFDWTAYDVYIFELVNIIPATNGQGLVVNYSQNGGSSWVTTASYAYANAGFTSANVADSLGGAGTAAPRINAVGNAAAGGGLSGSFRVVKPSSTTARKWYYGYAGYFDGTNYQVKNFAEAYAGDTNAINGIRWTFESGNIASGTFYAYGLKKS